MKSHGEIRTTILETIRDPFPGGTSQAQQLYASWRTPAKLASIIGFHASEGEYCTNAIAKTEGKQI